MARSEPAVEGASEEAPLARHLCNTRLRFLETDERLVCCLALCRQALHRFVELLVVRQLCLQLVVCLAQAFLVVLELLSNCSPHLVAFFSVSFLVVAFSHSGKPASKTVALRSLLSLSSSPLRVEIQKVWA